MPAADLEYAVHVDGSVPSRRIIAAHGSRDYAAKIPAQPDAEPQDDDQALFTDPTAAVEFAALLKRQFPTSLVSIVVWFES